jgi:hypothetical protein
MQYDHKREWRCNMTMFTSVNNVIISWKFDKDDIFNTEIIYMYSCPWYKIDIFLYSITRRPGHAHLDQAQFWNPLSTGKMDA